MFKLRQHGCKPASLLQPNLPTAQYVLARGLSSKSLRVHLPIQSRKMSSIARAKSLDHLVLTVKDLDTTVQFYANVLGMRHSSFSSLGSTRHALHFGNQKINLHISGHEFEPKADKVQPGSGDLCL